VAALADEVDDLKWGIQEEEDKQEQAAVSARALQLQQSVELAAVAAAIEAEEGRCSGAEKLLFCIESRLADLNDKFEREAIEAPLPDVPVRQVVREPEARSASEAATRALEHRLQKLIGCRCVCLCVCVCLSEWYKRVRLRPCIHMHAPHPCTSPPPPPPQPHHPRL